MKKDKKSNLALILNRKKKIDHVSSSFCLAKWLQSTLYLFNGHTHSCHHPKPHKINDLTDLHNTEIKINARKMMLLGQKPKECDYCWKIENIDQSLISDRIYKSCDNDWSFPFIDNVIQSKLGTKITPTYLEVAFSNNCNLKCIYCSPVISSSWMNEIKKNGAYPTTEANFDLNDLERDGKMPLKSPNLYEEAFFKWWPKVYLTLHSFRITGGEPLLDNNTWKIIDFIKENPRDTLNFSINTNMSIKPFLLKKLITSYIFLYKKIKKFEIYTSCEAIGQHAEYIRFGLDYKSFIENVRKYLSETNTDSRVNFMLTFNALSIFTFIDFINVIRKLRKEFNIRKDYNRLPFMISYLQWPKYLSPLILPNHIKIKYSKKINELIITILEENDPYFYDEEIDQLKRLIAFLSSEEEPSTINIDRMNFSLFIREHDKRRNVNFKEIFPELIDFYEANLACNDFKIEL